MLTESTTFKTMHVNVPVMSDCMHKQQINNIMEVKTLQGKTEQVKEASSKEELVGSISKTMLREEEEESQDSGYDEWKASGSDEDREGESDECGSEDMDDALVIDESLDSNPRSQDAESSSQLQRGRKSASENIRRRAEMRSESVKKMRDGKSWLVTTLIFVESTLSCVSLREVEDQYRDHCKVTKRDPVTTPVLARLIRSVFPGANKCRVGPRGSQKIHYRCLQWLQDASEFCTSEEVQSNQYELQEGTHSKSLSLTSEVKPMIGSVCNPNQEQAQQEEEQQECQAGNHESLSQKQIKGEIVDEKSYVLISKSEDEVEGDSAKKEEKTKEEKKKDLGQQGKKRKNESCEETEGQEETIMTAEAPEGGDFRAGAGKQDNEGDCEAAAEGMSRVIKWMFEQNKMNKLLLYFSHSASCRDQICSPICLMFRRVRRHVVGARHACSVLQVYATLLRTHVASCTSQNCGLPACPALRATQLKKRVKGEQGGTNKQSLPSPIIQAPHSHTITYTPSTPTTPPENGTTQIVYVPVMMHLADPRGA